MYKRRVDKSDTIHQIYANHKIKQQLIDYIYSVIDISKFKYKLLEVYDDLQSLKTAKYYISGNYTGPNCLMVFTRNKDRFYSFIVDRKTLSYKQSQINIDNVNMNPIELGLDESVYDGTIIDGILSQTDDKKVYIITDLYMFRGEDMTHEKVKYKLINIKKYLDTYINTDTHINNITVTVNNLYEIGEIKNLVYKVIPQTKQLPVRGIAFYPDISGTKLIYLFNKTTQHQPPDCHKQYDNQYDKHARNSQGYNHRDKYMPTEQFTQQRYQQHNQHNETPGSFQKQYSNNANNNNSSDDLITQPSKTKYRYICKTTEPVIITFELRRTEQYDVYKLFLIFPCNNDGKNILKTKRFGIAYIPTIECSKMCKNLTVTTGKVLMKCKYDDAKEKWIPIEPDTKKKCPDYVSTLEEKMDIVIDDEQ